MDFLHSRFSLNINQAVKLDCSHQCNFLLLDDTNFQNYRNGRQYRYYGGFFRKFPAIISAPYGGNWNVVIDLGGGRATIQHNLQVIEL